QIELHSVRRTGRIGEIRAGDREGVDESWEGDAFRPAVAVDDSDGVEIEAAIESSGHASQADITGRSQARIGEVVTLAEAAAELLVAEDVRCGCMVWQREPVEAVVADLDGHVIGFGGAGA